MSPRIAEVGHAWDRQELAQLIEDMGPNGNATADLESDGKFHTLSIEGVVIFKIEMHES